MTDTTTTEPGANAFARPAEQFHWLVDGIIWRAKRAALFGGVSEISRRGQTVTITSEMLDASPWISRYLGDEAAQLDRWGVVRIAPGPFPADASRWTYGDPAWAEAREIARRAAWAETDPERQTAARAAVEREFGPAPTTSTSNEIREHHTERRAREQAERISRGGADRRR